MKKLVITLFACVLSVLASSKANAAVGWDGIDEVNVIQKIDIDTCKVVYVYAHSTVEMKNNHYVEKQKAAIAELGQTVYKELKAAFGRVDFRLINSLDEAPADANIIDACFISIDWGNAALRQVVGFGAGDMSGHYTATFSNAKGRVCDLTNTRRHNTAFSSAKGAAVIKVFNQALATDLVTVLKKIK